MKTYLSIAALFTTFVFNTPVLAESDATLPKGVKKNEIIVPVYVNQVLKPYTLLKKINTEVYVLDSRSEAEAELNAFKKLQITAKEMGADGMIEVKRYVVKDAVAVRPTVAGSGSFFGDDVDATATVIDQLTLDTYERGQGTLSTTIIDDTFDRSKYSEKTVRFTGKAIKFEQ